MKEIIFDLDGILVDSAPSILASLAQAFADCGHQPRLLLTASLIGPPLRTSLADIYDGVPDGTILDRLIAAFKRHYGNEGARNRSLRRGRTIAVHPHRFWPDPAHRHQ